MKIKLVRRFAASVVVGVAFAALAAGGASAFQTLAVSVPDTQLPLDRVGQVRDQGGKLEIRDRQYEGEFGAFPVNINGTEYLADEIKVIFDLKLQNGTGEQRGTIDIDIDRAPGGHITLEYKGTATMAGSSITSSGEFKVAGATDVFAGTRVSGSYEMTIAESGSTQGSPANVTISLSGA
ncbi:MAG: DUF3211 family protein [Chloroflexi bacterium]|nr:DUF3211 family protein [Chloroflexota bacterium]